MRVATDTTASSNNYNYNNYVSPTPKMGKLFNHDQGYFFVIDTLRGEAITKECIWLCSRLWGYVGNMIDVIFERSFVPSTLL